MTKPRIMHMLFPGENVSPFDVNMIADAGYDVIMPYTNVKADEVQALVQDCIYSRPPGSANTTGFFIGGFDVNQAAEMFNTARNSMQSPFEVSVMVDPNGAYTTSAALVAKVEHQLQATGSSLTSSKLVIFGGGPVGNCVAVLAAQAGAEVVIGRLTKDTPEKRHAVESFLSRYQVKATQVDCQTDELKITAMKDAKVLVSSAKAGIEILSAELLQSGCEALVAADVNAVPPAGIAGVGIQDDGAELGSCTGCVGVGALAIGNLKYQTQQTLLRSMLEENSGKQFVDFDSALATAGELQRAGK